MARPSLKAEKTEHILQAYERCIAMYGVEGSTLQKVAEEADMARPLLRHYVGNQEELLAQSIARYFKRQAQEKANFQGIDSVETLLNTLFDKDYVANTDEANDIMIASAFTLASAQHPTIQKHMQAWFNDIKKDVGTLLTKLFPKADKQRIDAVSIGIIGIYFNLYAMQTVDSSAVFLQQSRQATELLLITLAS